MTGCIRTSILTILLPLLDAIISHHILHFFDYLFAWKEGSTQLDENDNGTHICKEQNKPFDRFAVVASVVITVVGAGISCLLKERVSKYEVN